MILEHNDYPYKFDSNKCDSCEGNCCIGESGYIWITKNEIDILAKHLEISVESLTSNSLRKVGYKYSIKEIQLSQTNFVCKFFDLDKKQCSIYEARPNQCRTFPFWEYFKNNIKEVTNECPAILID